MSHKSMYQYSVSSMYKTQQAPDYGTHTTKPMLTISRDSHMHTQAACKPGFSALPVAADHNSNNAKMLPEEVCIMVSFGLRHFGISKHLAVQPFSLALHNSVGLGNCTGYTGHIVGVVHCYGEASCRFALSCAQGLGWQQSKQVA